MRFISLLIKITLIISVSTTITFANENTAGELLLTDESGKQIQTLTLDTHINAEINGMVSSITVQQTFKNDSDSWVNGRYLFPLPEKAAVDGLKLIVGEREIIGKIKEKQQAKQIFTEAKQAGKKAGLLEQQRPNLFSIAVANIPPHEEIVAEIRIIDYVKYDNATFSLRLPTTLTPRYIPGKPISSQPVNLTDIEIENTQHIEVKSNFGWARNTHIVPDAAKITPAQIHTQHTNSVNQFSIDLTINAGIELNKVTSSSHLIEVTELSPTSSYITLENGIENMDSDLTISWQAVASSSPTAALFQQKIDNEYYSMAMLLPPTINTTQALPKDIIFIIDSSGSMGGNSMRQAKQSLFLALDKLSPNDRFNIIDFDDRFNTLFPQPVFATATKITQAKSRINNLHAGGGTEMYAPLEFALNAPSLEGYLKQVIFITDGSVGNEQQLFTLIQQNLNNTRLFTVGIGHAPNAFFMSKAAQFGRGTFTFIANSNETVPKMNALFNKINLPLARDLQISYTGKSMNQINAEQFPKRIPDLYAGEPILVFTKSNQPLDNIQITGSLLNKAWTRSITNSQSKANAHNLDGIWARKKVGHLMDDLYTGIKTEQEVKADVITLGINHHIVTKFTSFVAVEALPSKPKQAIAKDKAIKNLMPKGSTMVAPQTATSTTLFGIIGSLMMLIGIFMRNFQFIRMHESLLKLNILQAHF